MIFLSGLAVLALTLGLAEKYIPHALPVSRNPIGQWASAHFLVEAGRPDIAARRLQEEVQRGAALRQRAAVWRSVLLAGMGHACMDLGATYKNGSLKQPAVAGYFFAYVHEYGNCAKRYSVELGDILADRATWLGESRTVMLESNPPVVVSEEKLVGEIEAGILPEKDDALRLYSHRLQQGVSAVLHKMSPDGAREVPTRMFLNVLREELQIIAPTVGEPKRSELLRVASSL